MQAAWCIQLLKQPPPIQRSPKMDVYSFGVLLFELSNGELVEQPHLETTRVAVKNVN